MRFIILWVMVMTIGMLAWIGLVDVTYTIIKPLMDFI